MSQEFRLWFDKDHHHDKGCWRELRLPLMSCWIGSGLGMPFYAECMGF